MRGIVSSAGAPPVRVDPDGQFQVGQMHARHVRLEASRARFPLPLRHGGRPGWRMFVLRVGHGACVSDEAARRAQRWMEAKGLVRD